MQPQDERDQTSWHLDKRLNVTHLLTTVTMAAAIMMWGGAMDRRVAVLEEARLAQRHTDNRQDSDFLRGLDAMRAEATLLRDEIRETNRKLDRLIERGNNGKFSP